MVFDVRLLLRLRALGDFDYDLEYYPRVQGFLYDLLRGSDYDFLHDAMGDKFFCFSNIFPVPLDRDTGDKQVASHEDASNGEEEASVDAYQIRRGDVKYLIISTPDKRLFQAFEDGLREHRDSQGGVARFGNMVFQVLDWKRVNVRVPDHPFIIRSATPVVYRIYRPRYGELGIRSDKEYVYWREEYGLDTLLRLIREDISTKHLIFYGRPPYTLDFIKRIRFVKSVSAHFTMNRRRVQVVGSIIEIHIDDPLDREAKRVVRFFLDTGLGERNPLGFGFINIIRRKNR